MSDNKRDKKPTEGDAEDIAMWDGHVKYAAAWTTALTPAQILTEIGRASCRERV